MDFNNVKTNPGKTLYLIMFAVILSYIFFTVLSAQAGKVIIGNETGECAVSLSSGNVDRHNGGIKSKEINVIGAPINDGSEIKTVEAFLTVPEKNDKDKIIENKMLFLAPRSLKSTFAANGKVRIEWLAPLSDSSSETASETINYSVLRGNSVAIGALKEIKVVSGLSYEDTMLEDGKKYFYSVAAISDAGVRGPASPVIEVLVIDTRAPEPPANITAVSRLNKVELSWRRPANSDIAYYSIYKSESAESGFKKISVTALIADERFIDDQVSGGKDYYYKITASDKNANESTLNIPPVKVEIKLPLYISFAKDGEKSYYGFSFNYDTHDIYYIESLDGRTWSWWTPVAKNFPLSDNYTNSCRIAFAKEGAEITAFMYDTEKMSIETAVSNDKGKNWKWWETYSSSLPLPDGFDENAVIDFSVRDGRVYCICYNYASKTLSAASTANGKSWKWWKKYGEKLPLPNQSNDTQNSVCFFDGNFEVFSYNLNDKTLYKGVLPLNSVTNATYSCWNEVANKFPEPPR